MPRTKAFNEQEVLEKAMQLFWKQGYNGTSIQELIDHLGINRASLYNTYGDKEQLFEKTFYRYRKDAAQGLRDRLAVYEDVAAGIRAVFATAIGDAATDPDRKGCFVVNVTTELLPGPESLRELLAQHNQGMEDAFADYLQQGQAAGQVPDSVDIRSVAVLIYNLFNGIRVTTKVKVNQPELLNAVEQVLRLLG